MQTNSPEKKRRGSCFHGAYLALAVMLTIGAPGADATLLVYEGFDYTPGQTLPGAAGGSGFSNAWGEVNADQGTIRSGSLPSGSLPATGHSAGMNGGVVWRPVDEIAGTAGTQTWTSFLFSTAVSTVDTDYAACLALSPTITADSAVWVGAFDDGSGQLYLGLGSMYNTPVALSSIAVVPGETYLITVSIDWNAGSTGEMIRLYVNTSTGAAPTAGDAVASTTDINVAPPATPDFENRITDVYLAGLLAGEVSFDEIRIGTTFADVVPVPEPSTVGLVAVALGALARSRRVRRA